MESNRKSRGSFVDVRRKSLTFNTIFNEEKSENISVESPKHTLKTYLESLKKEKQDWTDILKENKSLYRNYEAKLKFESVVILKKDIEKYITTEDKEFLQNRPNYINIIESAKKYMDALNYLNKYEFDIIDYYDKACNELEINQMLLLDKMCAPNLCEICNLKNCQMEEHKFII